MMDGPRGHTDHGSKEFTNVEFAVDVVDIHIPVRQSPLYSIEAGAFSSVEISCLRLYQLHLGLLNMSLTLPTALTAQVARTA
jgi:hypothetical protein